MDLALPKGKIVSMPHRDPDYYSKRGVAYWWNPEWVRGLNSSNEKLGRIFPKKIKKWDGEDGVELYMLSKTGNKTFIRGSIQEEFTNWHLDNEIDYILLGVDIDEVLLTSWEYN